jgi:hypothetical protein
MSMKRLRDQETKGLRDRETERLRDEEKTGHSGSEGETAEDVSPQAN